MDYAITRFTFLADPLTYQAGPDELSVSLPAGLSSLEMLVKSLGERTGCSTELDITWWNTLFHILLNWSDWTVIPRRVTLLHRDLPKLADPPHTWWMQQMYLRLLLKFMDQVQKEQDRRSRSKPLRPGKEIRALSTMRGQEEQGQPSDPLKWRELAVIFPTQVYEELQAALFHPPVWQVTLGFPSSQDITGEWSASWSTVFRYLHLLDGLTARTCTLEREDVGTLTVFYRKADAAYYLEHQGPTYRTEEEKFALLEASSAAGAGLSFAQIQTVVNAFFTLGQLSSSVRWITFDHETWGLQDKLRGEEDHSIASEERLPAHEGMILETIDEGMREAVGEVGEQVFYLMYWKEVMAWRESPVSRKLTALCLIGLSDLPEAALLLRPFLRSADKRERWVSATLLGRQREEEALPILLSMLTDELPLKRLDEGEAYDAWYDCWRFYAPRLLRAWQVPDLAPLLRQALHLWIQSEPLFDPEYDVWERCEEALCYELGFCGDLDVLEGMTLDEKRREKLQRELKRGHAQKRTSIIDESSTRMNFDEF